MRLLLEKLRPELHDARVLHREDRWAVSGLNVRRMRDMSERPPATLPRASVGFAGTRADALTGCACHRMHDGTQGDMEAGAPRTSLI